MKKIFVTLLVLFIFSLNANPDTFPGRLSESETLKNNHNSLVQGLAKKVSLKLRERDIIETIEYLSEKGNLNIAVTSGVKGRITLFLEDVSIGDILSVILLANNLACEKRDNIIIIMADSEYKAIYGKPYGNNRILKMIELKYTDSPGEGLIRADVIGKKRKPPKLSVQIDSKQRKLEKK